MKFSIQCFDRCSQLPGKNFKTIQDGEKIWKEVTSVILEPCVNTILKHLVHGESQQSLECCRIGYLCNNKSCISI